ncbi:ABC transporter permease [Prauserella muralis]|uniref:Transport permease protein n=1 Tax=Prauserella muralis TaxID=588067 RepID=A0A2V4B7N1_9PSEU|nr:ABC transporter permease [Prauserella muralis]PXY31156.1 ABC transporter [Prauserella muralis]TWE14549.1 oleandomycin transport system permease protein [Prauserella muralis]
MTTLAAPPATRIGAAKALRHGLTLARRGVLKIAKNPEQLADVTIMPILFLVMFVYLFGGAISGDTSSYLQLVVPGIMVMTTIQASVTVGIALNTDVSKGVFDRFRSLPIARSAPLIGAVLADLVRYLVCLVVLLVVATIMGYRVGTSVAAIPVAMALMMAFGLAFCWIAVWVGMLVPNPGTVQGLMAVLIIPVSFGSNIFVPSETMPGWLQAWSDVNPVSLLADTLRGLLNGGPVAGPLLGALAWMAAILAVFFPLAMRAYRKRLA